MPTGSPVAGIMHRMATYDPLSAGQRPAIRPLGPGEYVAQAGGGVGSEEDVTVDQPGTNRAWLIPSLWLVNGVPTHVDSQTARTYALLSGLNYPSFQNYKQADAFANLREGIWEGTPEGNTSLQPPLWTRNK